MGTGPVLPGLQRAEEPDGLSAADFAGHGANVRTLRSFVLSHHDLLGVIRDIVMPNADLASA